jgi:general secretion pathway protein K
MSDSILRQEKGMVLLLVLVVVALLSGLLSEFAFSSLIDLRLAETYRDSTRAYFLARGGVRAAQMIIKGDGNNFDARSEMWGLGAANIPVGDGVISITIEDLDGRLSINSLVSGNNPQAEQKKRFLRLFEKLGIVESPQNLVAALIDWLDSGDEIYNEDGAVGAESSYYLGLDPPYEARNGSMSSIEELALVRGFTNEVIPVITPYVTLYGTKQVNCNTASPEVIATLNLDDEQPVALEDARKIADARDQADDFIEIFPSLSPLFPTSAELDYSLKYTSDYYRIRSQAWINDGTRTVTAVVRKSNNRIQYLRVD